MIAPRTERCEGCILDGDECLLQEFGNAEDCQE